MNDACPAQQHEAACARPELFERRRRRMEDRAAVSSPVHARFYSFQLPASPRQARQKSAIYLTPITNPQSRRFRRPFPIRGSERRACWREEDRLSTGTHRNLRFLQMSDR